MSRVRSRDALQGRPFIMVTGAQQKSCSADLTGENILSSKGGGGLSGSITAGRRVRLSRLRLAGVFKPVE